MVSINTSDENTAVHMNVFTIKVTGLNLKDATTNIERFLFIEFAMQSVCKDTRKRVTF